MRSKGFLRRKKDSPFEEALGPSKQVSAKKAVQKKNVTKQADPMSQSNPERRSLPAGNGVKRVTSAATTGDLDPSDNLYNYNSANSYAHTTTGMSHDKYILGVRSDSTDASSRAMWRSYTDDEDTQGEELIPDPFQKPNVSFKEGRNDQAVEEGNTEAREPAPTVRSPCPLPSILRTPSRGSAKGRDLPPTQPQSEHSVTFPSPSTDEDDEPENEKSTATEEEAMADVPPTAADELPSSVPATDTVPSHHSATDSEPSHHSATDTVPSPYPTLDPTFSPSVPMARRGSLRKEHFEPPEEEALADEGIEVVDGRHSSQTFQKLRKRLPERGSPKRERLAPKKSIKAPVDKSSGLKQNKVSSRGIPLTIDTAPIAEYELPAAISRAGVSSDEVNGTTTPQTTPAFNETESDPIKEDNLNREALQEEPASGGANANDKVLKKKKGQSENKGKDKKGKNKHKGRRWRTPTKSRKEVEVPEEIVFDIDKQEIPMPRSHTSRRVRSGIITEEIKTDEEGEPDLDIIGIAPLPSYIDPNESKGTASPKQTASTNQSRNACNSSNEELANLVGDMACGTDLGLFEDIPGTNEGPTQNVSATSGRVGNGQNPGSLLNNTGFSKTHILCEECIQAGGQRKFTGGKVCHKCLMLRVRSTVKSGPARQLDMNGTAPTSFQLHEGAQGERVASQQQRQKERQDKGREEHEGIHQRQKTDSAVTFQDEKQMEKLENIDTKSEPPTLTGLIGQEDNCFDDPGEQVERICALFPKKLLSGYQNLDGEGHGRGRQHKKEMEERRNRSRSRRRKARARDRRGPVPITQIEFTSPNEPEILQTVSSLTGPRRKKNQGDNSRGVSWSTRLKQVENESRRTNRKNAGVRKFFSGSKRSGKS